MLVRCNIFLSFPEEFKGQHRILIAPWPKDCNTHFDLSQKKKTVLFYLNNGGGYETKLKDHALLRVNRPYPPPLPPCRRELLSPVGHALGAIEGLRLRVGSASTWACTRASRKCLLCAFRFRIKTYKRLFNRHRVLLWGNVFYGSINFSGAHQSVYRQRM